MNELLKDKGSAIYYNNISNGIPYKDSTAD